MPFSEVPEKLISGRRVFLHKGQAFVPANLLKLVITRRFKALFKAALKRLNSFDFPLNVL